MLIHSLYLYFVNIASIILENDVDAKCERAFNVCVCVKVKDATLRQCQ